MLLIAYLSGQQVILRSDCKAIIDALQRGSFSDPRYILELVRIRLAAERFPQGVRFEHVYGHNGHPRNDEADRLATEATKGSRGRARSMSVNRRRSRKFSWSLNLLAFRFSFTKWTRCTKLYVQFTSEAVQLIEQAVARRAKLAKLTCIH
jgi:hypothetical protein